ncbi:MAG: vitamin K epoxide reductase family protein [Thermoleophilaceae bacterium]
MSERRLRVAVAALSLAGLGVAGYLTWVHYADIEPICAGGSGGCERVQSSDYAELAGVPVALLGLIGYGAILGSLALPGDAGRFAGALLAFVGFGFSAWLTYVELFEIDAICQWCVASAAIMTALAVVTSLRFAGPRPAESGHPRS